MDSRKTAEGWSRGEGKRSYLFLSMILLVWNTVATCDFLFRSVPPDTSLFPEETSAGNPPGREVPAFDNNVNPRNAALSVKQKYLIGKRIDINKALKEEINGLPGISDAMADAIVAERERAGGFRSPQELLRVKGIKEKRLKKILPFLVNMENN